MTRVSECFIFTLIPSKTFIFKQPDVLVRYQKRMFPVKIYRLRIFVLIGISYVSTNYLFSSGKYPHFTYLYTILSALSNICIFNAYSSNIFHFRLQEFRFLELFDGRSERISGHFSGNITLITKSKSLDFLL